MSEFDTQPRSGKKLPPNPAAIEARERLERQADPLGLTLRGKERRLFNAERPSEGRSGQFETELRTVVSPYEVGGTRRAETVAVNVRATPLDHLYARRKVTDAQYRAGEMFRSFCEAAELGGGVIDPARIRVDTSGAGDPLTERAMIAAQRLSSAAQRVGHMDFELLYEVCTVGRSLVEVAKRWYAGLEDSPRRAREAGSHISRRVQEALAELADLWGLTVAPTATGRTRLAGVFGKVPLDPEQWSYSPEKAKAERQQRQKQRRKEAWGNGE